MNEPQSSREGRPPIVARLSDFAFGDLPPAEQQELDRQLCDNPRAVNNLAELLLVEDDLRRLHDALPVQPTATLTRAARWSAGALAVAAGLALVLWLANPDQPADTSMALAEAPATVATEPKTNPNKAGSLATFAVLSGADRCQWITPAEPALGMPFRRPTRLRLAAGVADVVFDNGARMLLEGPCDVTLQDRRTCAVDAGRVTVRVTDQAFGFTVQTPTAVVVDLGTEFGVAVSDSAAEVHVFEGEVATQAIDAYGSHVGAPVRILADEARLFQVDGISLDVVKSNEAQFVRRLPQHLPPAQVPPLPVRDELALWLAADRQVMVDDAGRVQVWGDITGDTNTSAEDGLQPAPRNRPELIAASATAPAAIRFSGQDTFLITPPMFTSNDQTLFLSARIDQLPPAEAVIINYNGPPQRNVLYARQQSETGVLQLLLNRDPAATQIDLYGLVFTGYDQAERSLHSSGTCYATPVNRGEGVVYAYRYEHSANRAAAFSAGEQVATADASAPVEIISRKVIGRHPKYPRSFEGDIYELLIFNRGLTDAEVADVSHYLMDRQSSGRIAN